jgi:Tfp pilus assembly PilM family ATPase
MFTSIWNFLSAPTMPSISLAVTPSHVALVEMHKRGGNLIPKKLGVQNLRDGLVVPSLTDVNITKEAEFIDQLRSLADQAGFGKKLSLSLSLPEGSARSLVINLDQKPATHAELAQMIEWKMSRTTNIKVSEMRMDFQELSQEGGQPRWLVSAVSANIIQQYERLLAQLGWHAGVVLPQHIGEAQWLVRNRLDNNQDQVLVSVNPHGFVVVIVRGEEPLLIREINCALNEREDEFYRLMIFYKDKYAPSQGLKNMLVLGEPNEQIVFSQALSSALQDHPQKLSPTALGLTLDSSAPFNRFAAAAGLAVASL